MITLDLLADMAALAYLLVLALAAFDVVVPGAARARAR